MGTEQRNEIVVRCDFSGCSTTLRWIQQEVQAKPDALPDAAWRLLTFATFDGAVRGFCSKVCLLSYLREFVPLKSPRELAEIAETEKAEKAHVELALPAVVGVINPTTIPTVPDATGDSTEAA